MFSGKTRDWRTCRRQLLKVDPLGFAQRAPEDFSANCNDENFCGPSSMLDFSRLSRDEQDSVIYDELVMIYSGHDTVNIRRQYNEEGALSWNVNQKLDQIIRDQVLECLTLASDLITVKRHINAILSDGRRGTVAQSVAYFSNNILFENLEKLCFTLDDSPSKHVSAVLVEAKPVQKTVVDIGKILKFIYENNLIGGGIIGYLYEQKNYFLSSGFSHLLNKMIVAAEQAYYVILFDWITTGTLSRDGAYEFMVWDLKRSETLTVEDFTNGLNDVRIKNYDSFEKRFVFVADLCPQTLAPVQETIVKCGKYLYLYEQHVSKAKPLPLPLSLEKFTELASKDLASVIAVIKDTCKKSSYNLLKLLREKYDLDLFARALGQFFLDEGSDWLSNFVDYNATRELVSEQSVNSRAIKTWFDDAIDNSHLRNNKFRTNFSLCVKRFKGIFQSMHAGWSEENQSITAHMRESIAFDVTLNPAFAIIFPETIIASYNIFLHVLFQLKRIQVLLLRKSKELDRNALEERAMLYSMVRFVDKSLQFVSEWVISDHFKTFYEAISKATSIEEVVAVQDQCLNETTKNSSLDRECVEFVDVIFGIIMSYVTGEWTIYKELTEDLSKNLNLCYEVVSKRETELTPLTPLTQWLFRSSGSYCIS